MNTRTLTLTVSAIFGRNTRLEHVDGVLCRQEPIKVVLPHGEMELHSVGNVLSRQEYYKLTQAVGLVEARAVMSHHGLGVGDAPPDLTHFAPELAA